MMDASDAGSSTTNLNKVEESFDLVDLIKKGRVTTLQERKNRKFSEDDLTVSITEGTAVSLENFMSEDDKVDIPKLLFYLKKSEEHGVTPQISAPGCPQVIINHRDELRDQLHSWTRLLGTRDDELNTGSFSGSDISIGENYAQVFIKDEVPFDISYVINSKDERNFQVLLFNEDEYENWKSGRFWKSIEAASTGATSLAILPKTFVPNEEEDDYVLVIQPCLLLGQNYCGVNPLPTALSGGQKLYSSFEGDESKVLLRLSGFKVSLTPQSCSESGGRGLQFLLVFLPYVLVVLFGLRFFHMLFFCTSYRSIVEGEYERENNIPENEVDYWQPPPWDRKVPKTRLLGPCCWKKFRRPTEPFYTWWRHENYFTWIFFPYRNERLSRMERGIIIFSSLYVTFYALFVVTLFFGDVLDDSVAVGAVLLYLMITLVPAIFKALFKEVFKLFYRKHRDYFRRRRKGRCTKSLSFRSMAISEIVVIVLLTVIQLPLLLSWLSRSCAFLNRFLYFWLLSIVTRLSIIGMAEDLLWYLLIKTFGWRDLCPYCTERLVHCEDFNDDLLIIAVSHIGAHWELIKTMDSIMNGEDAQFELYSADQLKERWHILVERSKKHMKLVEKLKKKRIKVAKQKHMSDEYIKRIQCCTAGDCYKRELLILGMNEEIGVCPIKKHYDSNFSMAVNAMKNSLSIGIEKVFSSPEDRLRENEEREDIRRRIYDNVADDASITSDESTLDGMDMEDRGIEENEYGFSSPQTPHIDVELDPNTNWRLIEPRDDMEEGHTALGVDTGEKDHSIKAIVKRGCSKAWSSMKDLDN